MRKLLVVVGALLVTAAAPAQADTITFIDTSESVSLTGLGTRESATCTEIIDVLSPEGCTVTITLPATTDAVTVLESTQNFTEPALGGQISDTVSIVPLLVGGMLTGIVVTLTSDSGAAGGLGVCLGGCVVETGQVQLAATIAYLHGSTLLATDTFNICSDVEGVTSSCSSTTPVPESASLVLLGAGLLVTVSRFRRRHSRANIPQ